MAIVKTDFTGEHKSEQYEQVLTWFQNNVSDYFTTVDGNPDNQKIFLDKYSDYSGRVTVYTNNDSYDITIALGPDSSSYTTTQLYATASDRFDYAVKTNNGIFLQWGPTDTIYYRCCMIISKTSSGHTFLVYRFYNGLSTDGKFAWADLTYPNTRGDYILDGVRDSLLQGRGMSTPAMYTTLTPIAAELYDEICPYVFLTHFNQYKDLDGSSQLKSNPGKLTLGGYDYFTDGYLALSDYPV